MEGSKGRGKPGVEGDAGRIPPFRSKFVLALIKEIFLQWWGIMVGEAGLKGVERGEKMVKGREGEGEGEWEREGKGRGRVCGREWDQVFDSTRKMDSILVFY